METAKTLVCVLLFYVACTRDAIGLGPVIDVHPAEIQIDHTDTLDIVCTFNIDSTPNMAAIISLIISWSVDSGVPFTEMAAITEFSPHTVNQLTSANVSGVGFLSEDGESYLHLEWKFPSELQAGVYQCSANGVDLLGHNLVMDASAQVTVKGADTAHCMDTLDEVRKNASNLEQIVTDMENYTKMLELRIAELENSTKILEGELANERQCGSAFTVLLPADFEIGMRYKCHNYYISLSHGFEFQSATTTCKSYGGYLTEINDSDEFHALQAFLNSTTGLDWILVGANEEVHSTGGSNCLAFDGPTWNIRNVVCLNTYTTDRFMCEVP